MCPGNDSTFSTFSLPSGSGFSPVLCKLPFQFLLFTLLHCLLWEIAINSFRLKCVSKLNIIGSNNDLSPGQRQVIIWTNAGILLICPLRTKFSEMLIEIHAFLFKKNTCENVVCKMVDILSRPPCVNTKNNNPCLFSRVQWWSEKRYHFIPSTLRRGNYSRGLQSI